MARGISLVNMAMGDFREVTEGLPDTFLIPVSKVWIETQLRGECEFTLINRDAVNQRYELKPAGEIVRKEINTNRYNASPPPAQCKAKPIELD